MRRPYSLWRATGANSVPCSLPFYYTTGFLSLLESQAVLFPAAGLSRQRGVLTGGVPSNGNECGKR